ncbi:helix-turn-helix domain-containing protein [Enterococcus termitis]|uniref:Mga helix-turn-helix domain-containing protein n=1 Tax=Enterococcus termitis TaxID=332950 RepID=A0A1E5G8S9_9ENTE|nr:helix-turn-helix domain-containing protein [Enterococcus termitis]OEG09123.1 hypothetical protein BCR25_11170 [Enterococcus termitis]
MFLRTLYNNERWFTEKELSKIGKCSSDATYRTLNLLRQIKYDQNDSLEIISKKNKGFFLQATPLHSIGETESLFIKDTISYRLIDLIFHEQGYSLADLADIFYVSTSTIYRKLKNLAEYFNENGLTLNMNNFVISGPEHAIREFFYRFYWSVIKSSQWPFKSVSFEEILTLYSEKMSAVSFQLTDTERLQFLYRLAINHIRYQHQHFITTAPNKNIVDPYIKSYSQYMKKFITIEVPAKYHVNEWTFLSLLLISSPVFDELHIDYEIRVNWHKNKKTPAYLFAISIIHAYKLRNEKLIFMDETKLIFRLLSSYVYTVAFPDLTIHHLNVASMLHSVSELNYIFFEQSQQIMSSILHLFPEAIKQFDQDYLLYNILLIASSSLKLEEIRKEITVKLICTVEPLSEEYLSQKLIKFSNHDLIVHTGTTQQDHDKHYDLLLSDIQFDKHVYPHASKTYIWDFLPNERDWKNIFALIDSIANEDEYR